MRRIVSGVLAAALLPGAALAQVAPDSPAQTPTPIEAAPPPAVLLAQLDDSDLANEETLEELMQIEIDRDAQSMGAAIGLSLIPGGGWGLLYAGKPAQSAVPFTLAAAGFVVGALYAVGTFDTSTSTACAHVRDGNVPDLECTLGDDAIRNKEEDPRADPNTLRPPLNIYANTKSDYEVVTSGEAFDGQTTGLVIIGATYALTTLVGAIWAGTSVAAHNERVKRDVESTASMPRPSISYDGDRGSVGLTIDF